MTEAASVATTADSGDAGSEGKTTAQEAVDLITKPSDTKQPEAAENEKETAEEPNTPAMDAPDDDDIPDDLGDAGKRAIDRMKDERNKAIRAQKRADKQLAEAQQTIKRLRVEKLATGRLRNPSDALVFLTDLKGDEDEKTVGKAIDKLIEERPYLAPDVTEKHQENAEDDLKSLFPDQKTLKPSDQSRVNADAFGGILEQFGL